MRRRAFGGMQFSSAELVGKKGTTKKLLAKRTKQFADLGGEGNASISHPNRKQPFVAAYQKATHEQNKAK